MRILPVDQEPEVAREFLNERSLQVGHVLPLDEKTFGEYFPSGRSFLILKGKRPEALFSLRAGTEKEIPTASLRLVSRSKLAFKEAIQKTEQAAIAQEKLIIRTTVFGYDQAGIDALKASGYRIGASLPEGVSFRGMRYDLHFLYADLTEKYSFNVRRKYAGPGLYPAVAVSKAASAKLNVRGYRAEDQAALDKYVTHQMVIRTLGSGVFEGLYPWTPGSYQELVNSGRTFPIVCEDETKNEVVGLLDLFKMTYEVSQHTMGLGVYVKPEYQGLGVGTMLMQNMKTLAKRLHLASVWLSVFEGNIAAERLYRKTGFVECGKLPGWLQEGYIDEVYMTLKLD